MNALDVLKEMVDKDVYFTSAVRQDNVARTRRRARTLPTQGALDVTPFLDIDVAAPCSRQEAAAAGAFILAKQRGTLKELFQAFQENAVRERLKEDYLFYGPNAGSLSAYSSPSLGNPSSGLDALCADLSYDIPNGFGPWLIVTTDRARKDLAVRRRKGKVLYESALDVLRALSFGQFSADNMKPISNDSPVHILEARLPDNPRLVYQVHVVRDTKDDVVKQAILVFGIYTHQDIKRISWDKYARQQARRGKEYVDACRRRPKGWRIGQDAPEPQEFPGFGGSLDMVHSSEGNEALDPEGLTEKEADELHNLLVLGQHSTLNQNFLDGLDKKQLLAQLYYLSDDERDVVHYPKSCLVLGRSGTGKTTTVFFKIAGIERAWAQLADAQTPRPRQVFVTRSANLVRHVEGEFVAFARSEAIAPNAPPHLVARANRIREQKQEQLYEDGAWRADLPKRFSQLQDEHFPLFVTYDELCEMVENDFLAQDQERRKRTPRVGGLVDEYRRAGCGIITFDTFKTHYWPRMPANLVRHQDPAVVFGQFIGLIEGCEATLQNGGSPLDRDAYERLRVQSIDYSLYEAYTALKRKRHGRDAADRAHGILNVLRSRRFPGKKVDYIYTDEVQDNTLPEISLVYQFCRNSRGYFWAGDTAQTIAHGSNFRFADLRAFLYAQDRDEDARTAPWIAPEPARFFHLSINYRSPGGVVECAHSIVELLSRFPRSIDELKREEGIIPGLKPLLVQVAGDDDIRRFFCVRADGSCSVGPGSNQTILVRNKDVLNRLKALVGNVATVTAMTIYQSKGLESDDILLFNFFADSGIDARMWSAMFAAFTMCPGQLDGLDRRFTALVLELKNLYVAITRTKRRLWIVDDPVYSGPMITYWAQHNLVTMPDASVTTEQFIDHSKDHEWKGTAFRFFKRGLYDQAANAYERAGDPRTARLARAMYKYQCAFEVPVSEKRRRRESLESSAYALLQSAREAEDASERKGAAGKAADCYMELEDHRCAAEAYECGRDWSNAARQFMKARMMDKAVDIVQDNEDDLEDGVQAAVYTAARSLYLTKLEVRKAAKLFDNDQTFDEFMVAHEFNEARAVELERRQEPTEAARLYFEEGQVLKALQLLVENSSDIANVTLALERGFSFLWSHRHVGSSCVAQDSALEKEILEMLDRLPLDSIETDAVDMAMFKAVACSHYATLMRIASQADSGSPTGRARIVLCLNHCFQHDDMSLLRNNSENELLDVLDCFRLYATTLHQIITSVESVVEDDSDDHLRRCLGVETDGDTLRILDNSFLAYCFWERHGREADLCLSRPDLIDFIRSALSRYLKCLIDSEHAVLKSRAHIFDPCFNASLHGHCTVQHSKPVAHQLDQAWYNRRVRLHLLQIEILHVSQHIPHADDFRDRVVQQRQWLARLENALNPLLYLNGSQSLLRANDIPDAERGLSVVQQWSLDVLFYLDPRRFNLQNAFLGNFLNAAKLGLRLHAQSIVERHLLSVPCVAHERREFRPHPKLWVGPRYTLPALSGFLCGEGDVITGVAFLNLIIDRRLPLDFTTLCDFIDRLAGLYVMTRAQNTRGSLKDVLLPSSWLVELWPAFSRFQGRNTANLDNFLQGLVRLLGDVYGGIVSVTNVQHRVNDLLPDAARDVCMSRICRDLYLISLNVGDFAVRDRVLSSITSLRTQAAPGFTPLSRDFLFALDWKDLSKAALESCRRSISDEMILLKVRPTVTPLPMQLALHGVRQVIFSNTEDIPGLLQTSGALSDRYASPRLSATAPVFQPRPTSSTVYTESSRERAAATIQKFWLVTRRRIPDDPLEAAQYRWTLKYRRHAQSICWIEDGEKTSKYRIVFKLYLPRLLSCLDWAVARARDERVIVKQRRIAAELEDADPEEHGVLLARMADVRRVEREARELRSQLIPTSTWHTRGDGTDRLKELHRAAQQLQCIVQTLQTGPGTPSPIDIDLALALRGIRHVVSSVSRSRLLETHT
ncbi:hypothetical protein PENSPDRAFT_614150 [Peniophora sp. CONT]|nr:hypothetical protein PENSPDRAFT_614150 [Peniophora sp. CONT]